MELKNILKEIDVLKARLDGLRPLPTSAINKINEALEIEYTYDSNRIEGNTLTLMETSLVINEGITISGKPLREHLEAINHNEAIDFIKEIANKDIPINETVIKDIHAIILKSIDKDNAGRYRSVPVMIAGSKHMPPQHFSVPQLMEDFIKEYERKEKGKLPPVLIAAYLHYELVRIHPFIDGNGRTSRLLMNLYLLRNGYPIVNIKGDNETRYKYYNALEDSHNKTGHEEFNIFVAEAVRDSLKNYLSILEG